VQAATGDHGVGPAQVDVFKQAPLRVGRGENAAPQPVGIDRNQFTRRDLPDERCPDDVQPPVSLATFQAAKYQRPDPLRVPRGVQRLLIL
jgi:hypothetical protein